MGAKSEGESGECVMLEQRKSCITIDVVIEAGIRESRDGTMTGTLIRGSRSSPLTGLPLFPPKAIMHPHVCRRHSVFASRTSGCRGRGEQRPLVPPPKHTADAHTPENQTEVRTEAREQHRHLIASSLDYTMTAAAADADAPAPGLTGATADPISFFM